MGLQSAVIPGNYRKMFLNGVETFPGALGCCLAAKMTEINCLTGWLLGNLMKFFQNLTARGGLGVFESLKIGFQRKDPGFSVSRFLSDDPQIVSRFHQRRKKLGPKMSTGGGKVHFPPPVTGEWKYAL